MKPKFDFKRAKELARKAMKNPLLEAVILGPQGAGKSTLIGTLGVKTLYLYGTRESHGPKAAAVKGEKMVEPLAFDHGIWPGEESARQWTADESWEFLTHVLADHEHLKAEKYQAIAVDGFKVLEDIIKETTEWREKCKTSKGGHNSFRETESSQEMFGKLVALLKTCQRELNTHIIVTGTVDVKDSDQFGAYTEAVPRLGGYGLAESLNQFFADVLLVGKMSKNGEAKYKLQFLTDLTKISKDESGQQKRAMNFNPRVTGVEMPPYFDADLKALAELKKEKMK